MRPSLPPCLRLVATLAALIPAASQSQEITRPNILFIAVDDLVPRIGPCGDSTAITPRMDELAATGLTFLNHHAAWPVCGPSRAALTTSLTPEETRVIGFTKIRDKNYLPDVITLPQHFRNQGYETAATGKFHDYRTVGTPTEISDTYPAGVMDNGITNDDPASWSIPYVKAESGFSVGGSASDATDQDDSLYEDHKILTAGLALLDDLVSAGGTAPGNKPFFLAVGFKKPHLPFVVPRKYWDLYTRANFALPQTPFVPTAASTYLAQALTDNSEISGYEPFTSNPALIGDPDHQRELMHGYYASVSFIDALVGQLLDRLAATPDPRHPGKQLADTTIVVLWGDHGFHLGEQGHWAKHTPLDAATASPLIIRDPRRPRTAVDNRSRRPVGTTDIYPTLCELAGLPIPSQPISASIPTGRPLRGRSLVPLFTDPAAPLHDGAVSQFNTGGQYGYAYRTDRFRYIEWISATGNMDDGNVRRDLYDLVADPRATLNVAADPAYAGTVWQLSHALRAETTTRGTGRLALAAPVSPGNAAWLPARIAASASPGSIRLDWPAAAGTTAEVLFSDDLVSWTGLATLQAGQADFPFVGQRAFFRVRPGSLHPPLFTSDPLLRANAAAGVAYADTLAGAATDADPGDAIVYTKLDGPAWLAIAPSGQLSGTPSEAEIGAHYFTVSATDTAGHTSSARLQISVVTARPAASISKIAFGSVNTGTTYGTPFFTNVTVQSGDLLVIAHANNKNTTSNTITLTGLGSNVIGAVNSGSTGTTSAAWVFTSLITESGTFSPILDTSSATKTVSSATTYFVLRPVNGTLSVMASAGASASASPGVTSLNLNLVPSAPVTAAYGIAAAAINAATSLGGDPAGWATVANGNNKRRTYLATDLSGATFPVTFGTNATSDLAVAGVIIGLTPLN